MKLQINYKHLAAEFVIVVVGVAVALAADSWRQESIEASEEVAYIERLKLDLQSDQQRIESDIATYSQSLEATDYLVSVLENAQIGLDSSKAVSSFIRAARTFVDSSTLTQDIAYQELIATGDLNIIRSFSLRESLTRYYMRAAITKTAAERIPTSIQLRFQGLTGNYPYYYLGLGNPLTSKDETRLLEELEDENILRELRVQRSALVAFNARLAPLAELNAELLQTLDN